MNFCYLFGEVYTLGQYKFFYNSKKHVAVVKFKIKTRNDIINVIAYDELADYIYSSVHKKDIINIVGWIDNRMIVNIEQIEKVKEV